MRTLHSKPQVCRVSRTAVVVVFAVSALPWVLSLLGADFSAEGAVAAFVHTVTEWTGFCAGTCALLLALLHFGLRGDVTTAIIAVALFTSGLVDAVGALITDGRVLTVANREAFVSLVWLVSRVFSALLLSVGATIFLFTGMAVSEEAKQKGRGFIVGVSACFIALAFLSIYFLVRRPELPVVVFPEALIHRPWDMVPLALFLFAGLYVFPAFAKWHPSYFATTLWLSAAPHIAAQVHMIFGSEALYDSHFNIASFLKCMAYLVPLHGLREDYRATYELEQKEKTALAAEILRNQQVSEALARDHELLNLLMTHTTDAISIKDVSLRYIRINRTMAVRLGLKDRAEAIGKHASDFERGEPDDEADRRVLQTGRAAGERRPLLDRGKRVVGVVQITPATAKPAG